MSKHRKDEPDTGADAETGAEPGAGTESGAGTAQGRADVGGLGVEQDVMAGPVPGSGAAADSDRLLSVRGLSVGFRTDDGLVRAVRDVSFDLAAGEVLGIVGESGSGKSVSSQAIMGLLPKTADVEGSIKYRGTELVGLSYKQLQPYRGNNIAMIFQDPMTSLNPVFTVGRQLAEAYRAHHKVSRRAAHERAVEALKLVDIPQPDKRVHQFPHEFSGGMRQRVVIAMAIINDPDLIIADEPTTALDVTVQAQILETLLKIRDETSAGVMIITHDLGVVAGMVDRVQVMYGGTVVEAGPVDTVFDAPRMPYTVGLLGSIPNPSLLGKRLTPIQGAPPSLMNLPPGCAFAPRCPIAVADCQDDEPELTVSGGSDHVARCFRSEYLAGVSNPQTLFAHEEIGAVENPVALTMADPSIPVAAAIGTAVGTEKGTENGTENGSENGADQRADTAGSPDAPTESAADAPSDTAAGASIQEGPRT